MSSTINYDELDIYILDNDQPTTCPKCGVRTDWIEIDNDRFFHTCLDKECNYQFIGEFETDEERESYL